MGMERLSNRNVTASNGQGHHKPQHGLLAPDLRAGEKEPLEVPGRVNERNGLFTSTIH
jgi:hypothetical protein